MIFQKKVHKYTFFEEITDNAMSINTMLMVYFGCTLGVLWVYFGKYTRNQRSKRIPLEKKTWLR